MASAPLSDCTGGIQPFSPRPARPPANLICATDSRGQLDSASRKLRSHIPFAPTMCTLWALVWTHQSLSLSYLYLCLEPLKYRGAALCLSLFKQHDWSIVLYLYLFFWFSSTCWSILASPYLHLLTFWQVKQVLSQNHFTIRFLETRWVGHLNTTNLFKSSALSAVLEGYDHYWLKNKTWGFLLPLSQ